MASNSDFGTRLCVVWKIENPFTGLESPVFSFMSYEWCLRLYCDLRSPILVDYIRLQNNQEWQRNLTFRVTTYIENEKNKELTCCQAVDLTPERRWRFVWMARNSIPYIFDFKGCDKLTVVCMLESGFQPRKRIKKETGHKSNPAYFGVPLMQEVLFQDTGGDPSRRTPPEEKQEVFLDSPRNLDSLSQDMSNLLESSILPDVHLKCEYLTFPAHRAILAARSEVFSAMFRYEMTESSSGIIEMKDIDPAVLDIFLKYLYSGKALSLTEDMVPKLYAAGDKYAVDALKKLCSDFMVKSVNEHNFLQLLMLADAHGDQEFKEAVACFITEHNVLLTTESWFRFSDENPTLAIQVYRKFTSKSVSK